jgi:plastocyanin
MRSLALLLVLLAMAIAPVAKAASLSVRVVDQNGRPVEDAVVTLAGGVPAARNAPATYTIDQKQLTFLPFVQVLRPGDSVVFRNSDRTRHHVYSFSDTRAFEFVLAPGQSSAPLALPKEGVAAVGCNIHDGMINYLYVTAARAVRTDARGVADFSSLPPGRVEVRVWQPRLAPGHPEGLRQATLELSATDAPTLQVALRLRPDPRRMPDHERMRY